MEYLQYDYDREDTAEYLVVLNLVISGIPSIPVDTYWSGPGTLVF